MSRRNNRKNPHKTPPSQRDGNGHERTYLFTEPPAPPTFTDCSRVWIAGGPGGPPPEDEREATAKAGFGSRGNSLKAGLRSRLLFPESMMQAIDERDRAFAAQLRPLTILDKWLVRQMARGSVQSDLAADQLLINLSLAIERVDTRWPDDRREHSERLGERIVKAPCRIARELARSKYGAIYLIDQLTSLGESIAANGALDPEQRERLFDVLGVDPVFRNGSLKVPAGSDGPGLAAVVEKEKTRLSTKLERELNARDLQEQAATRLGIIRYHDLETRNLLGSQRRADRRYQWAWQVLCQVRAGVDPATIIDPETRRPINPEADAPPAPEAAAPAQPAPTSTAAAQPGPTSPAAAEPARVSPTDEPAVSAVQIPRIPEGLPEEMKQMFRLVGEAYCRGRAPADKETLLADEPSGETGPLLPG